MASTIRTKIVTAAVAAAVGLTGFIPTASAGILDILGGGLSISAGEQSDYYPGESHTTPMAAGAEDLLNTRAADLQPGASTSGGRTGIWPSARYETLSRDIARIINEHRSSREEPTMRLDASMSASAQRWAEEMAEKDFFEHDFNTRYGEIIAMRFDMSRASTAERFVQQWENSPAHAELMHRKDFFVMGVGVAEDPNTLKAYAVVRLYFN